MKTLYEQIEELARELCIKDNKDPDEIIEYEYPEEFLQGELAACKKLGILFEKAVHPQWENYQDQAKHTLIHQEPHEVLCNLCGGSCWDKDMWNTECMQGEAYWGYGSSNNKDTTQHSITICESCYDNKITPMLVIPAKVKFYMWGND